MKNINNSCNKLIAVLIVFVIMISEIILIPTNAYAAIDDLEKQIMSFANKIPENEWESIKLNIKLTYIKKGE